VVEVSKAIRTIGLDETLEILATDPGFPADIRAFATRTGHALLALESADGGFRALIRRAR
jgi:tRNA 2-thiouridine synthesizing protein A